MKPADTRTRISRGSFGSAQEPAERIALDAAMVHPWVLQGTRPALKPAPETVSARPLLTAVQVLR